LELEDWAWSHAPYNLGRAVGGDGEALRLVRIAKNCSWVQGFWKGAFIGPRSAESGCDCISASPHLHLASLQPR